MAAMSRYTLKTYSLNKTRPNHVKDLEETFKNIRKASLRLKGKKCTFGVRKGQFVGYKITPKGIQSRKEKIEAITSMMPQPQSGK